MDNSKKEEKMGRTDVVPNEEISGSDADKAYNENGDFGKGASSDKDAEKSDVPPGSDADGQVGQ